MRFFGFITFFLFSQLLLGQELKITSYQPVPDLWLKLWSDNEIIRDDYILNEQLLDLVQCFTIDSVYERKTERHQVVGGAMLRVLGFRWLTINHTREKFVGTEEHGIRIQCEERFTENDINWDLYAHTPKYMQMVYEAYQAQIARRKGRKKKSKQELSSPPYTEPTLETAGAYRVHPELTPLRALRTQLNDMFYPCLCPNSLTEHPNFGEESPTIGVYGPWILDCNHSCYPEIHPYEWIWWMDLNPRKKHPPNARTWLVGFFRDASNRFVHWSSKPRTGQLSIPFVFPMSAEKWKIDIDHLAYTAFDEEAFQKLKVPEKARPFDFNELQIHFNEPALKGKTITITTNHRMRTKALQFWIGDLDYDKKNGFVSGRLYLAASVEDSYTVRVTTQFE